MSQPSAKTTPCVYFKYGTCKNGLNCEFVHTICIHDGRCRSPMTCKFKHERQVDEQGCFYGYKCTDKSCKAAHPQKSPCRNGPACPDRARCTFLHPDDPLPRQQTRPQTSRPQHERTPLQKIAEDRLPKIDAEIRDLEAKLAILMQEKKSCERLLNPDC